MSGEIRVRCRNHAAFSGGDVFVSEKAETSRITPASACAPVIASAWRVSRVFDDQKSMQLCNAGESVHVGGDACVVDGKDSLCSRRNLLFRIHRIHGWIFGTAN